MIENSYLCCASFTTTGNKSKPLFGAFTVEEGGRRMELEKDEKQRKKLFCPLKDTGSVSFHSGDLENKKG